MATVFLGVGVVFGTDGTTAITGSGIGGTFTLQTSRHTKSADKDIIRAATGVETQATFYNNTEEATFEYFVTAATAAAAITANTMPAPGTIVTVTNALKYPAIASTAWFVYNDPEHSETNTGSARITLHLKRWPDTGGIQAVST